MTFKTKYRQNKRLLQGYVAYLEYCTTYEQKLKLSTEIGRLNKQNQQIEKMDFSDTKKDSSDYTIKVNAEL